MIGFQPFSSPLVLWAWLIALGAVFILTAHRLRAALRPGRRALILALRTAAAGLILLFLLRPFLEKERPDPSRFRVALLTDCSASMKTRDCPPPRTSRLEAASGPEARELIQRLNALYRFRPFVFADRLKPAFGPRPAVLPGNTALGDVLLATPAEFPNLPLGAVLLLSDGHSNEGTPPTQAAKQLRRRGIPVSVVGTGEVGRSGDVAVRFEHPPTRSPAGRPLELSVGLRNTLPQKIETRLVLTEGGRRLQSRTITLRPGADARTETFRLTPAPAGFRTYAVRLERIPGDTRPETDVDYTGVEITDPVVFHILYLGDRLSWEYKFLKMAADANRQVNLAAAIRMAPDAWYHAGFDPGTEPKDFPRSPDALNRFDAIVAHASFLGRLDAPARKTIRNFVSRRGGGLLCVGATDALPPDLRALLPVLAGSVKQSRRRLPLVFVPGFIFRDDPDGVLTGPPGPYLPPNVPAWIVSEWKKGARPVLLTPDGRSALLVAQAYGSGRVACLGVSDTWRWRLGSRAGLDLHQAFWDRLLAWLGSTAKSRFAVAFDGRKVPAGKQVELGVKILRRDYGPAADARVTAAVTGPDGRRRELVLQPSDLDTGAYSEWFRPEQAGEYAVDVEVRRPDETLRKTAHFVARWTGAEATDTTYREGILRDVARITGGVFRPYAGMRSFQHLPLSRDVPVIRRRVVLSETAPWLLAVLLLASVEWYVRRRSGLR